MKKEYLKPSLRDHMLKTSHILADSIDSVQEQVGDETPQLSKETSFDWGDSWNDDSDQ